VTPAEERVLVLAPTGRDGGLLRQAIRRAGFESQCCLAADELLREAAEDAGAVLLTEEAVTPQLATGLGRLADEQATWSDLPILLITSDARRPSTPTEHLVRVAGSRGNVTLLERPIRIGTLVSTVTTALRSRRRQYEIRDYLAERRNNEEQMRETQKLESIGVLAGGIAHDFNNLLTGIIGNTSLALDMAENDPGQTAVLREVMQAGQRAADLTMQLLAYAGKGRFVVRPIDLSVLTGEIAPLVKTFIPRAAQVEMSLIPNPPLVDADASQVQQVVMNLIINAAESLPEGSSGHIKVTTGFADLPKAPRDSAFIGGIAPSGRFVFVEVQDNGCGMSEEVRGRIFDPFYTTKFLGRGLGLSAVMGIVRSHGGALRLESAQALGSTFTAYFPVSSAVPSAASRPTLESGEPLHGTVLFVDDEHLVCALARQALTRRGIEVLLASNGQEAVEIFRTAKERISLIILDLTMPVWGGEHTYEILRRISPDVPVVLSSGYAESMLQERFADRGLSGFLQKPYTARELVAKIRSVLVR
jgi:signal transduction histidine kinase